MKDTLALSQALEASRAELAGKTQRAQSLITDYSMDAAAVEGEIELAKNAAQQANAPEIIYNLIGSARENGDFIPDSSFYVGRLLAVINALEAQFMPAIEGLPRIFPPEVALDIIGAAELRTAMSALTDAREFNNGAVSDPVEAEYIQKHMNAALFCTTLRHDILGLRSTIKTAQQKLPRTKSVYSVLSE